MLKTIVADSQNKRSAEVDITKDERQALVVATRPLKVFQNQIKFFTNSVYGSDLNQNASFGGSPIPVHNGEDASYWTASAIIGGSRWDFSSTDQAHGGTQSVDGTLTINNDVAQFAKGSSQDLTGYTAITGWIYLTGWADTGTKAVAIYGWDGAIVGNLVNIGNYIDKTSFGTWQKFSISLNDLGLTNETIDSIRIGVVDIGAGAAPNFYLDDIQIEETGNPLEFRIDPDNGTWMRVKGFNIIMADAFDNTVINASSPNIPYNTLLGVSKLDTGIIYRRVQDDEVVSVASIRQFLDIMTFSKATVTGNSGDGTNTWVTVHIEFTEEVILKSEDTDYMSLTISDDLSGLLAFKMSASAKVETRL
jgi:hypothetical protein